MMIIGIVVYLQVCGHGNKQTVVPALQTPPGDTSLKQCLGHNQNYHPW